MRIIIELDEQGEVTVEREGEPAGGATRVSNPRGAAAAAIDAGPPPAWLLRALGAPPVTPRAAAGQAADTDGGAARA